MRAYEEVRTNAVKSLFISRGTPVGLLGSLSGRDIGVKPGVPQAAIS